MIPERGSQFLFLLVLPFLSGVLTAQGRPEISSMKIAGEEVKPGQTASFRVFEDDLEEFDGALPVTGTVDPNGYQGNYVVEVTTDGGQTWHRAKGKREWRYRFRPFRAQKLEIAARVVTDYVGSDALLRITDLSVEGPGGEQIGLSPAEMEADLDPGAYTVSFRVSNTGDEPAGDLSLIASMEPRGTIDRWTLDEEGRETFGSEIQPGESGRLSWTLSVPNPRKETSLTILVRRGDSSLAKLTFTVVPRDEPPGFEELSILEVTRFQVRKKGEDPTNVQYTELLEPGSYQLIVGVYNGSDQAVDRLDVEGRVVAGQGRNPQAAPDDQPLFSDEQFFSDTLSPGEGRTARADFTIEREHVNRMARFEVLLNGDPIKEGSIPIVPVYDPGSGVSIQKFTLKEFAEEDRETREVPAEEGSSPPVYQVFPGRVYYGVLHLYNRTEEPRRNVPVHVSRNDRTTTYRAELIRPGTRQKLFVPLTEVRGRVRFQAGSSDSEDERSHLAIRLVRPALNLPDVVPRTFSLESPMYVTVPGTELEFKVDPNRNATRDKFYGQAQLVYRRGEGKQLYPDQPIDFGTRDRNFELNSDNVITGINTPDGAANEVSLDFSKQLLVKSFLKLRYGTLTLRQSGANGIERELRGTLNAGFMKELDFASTNPRRPLLMTARKQGGDWEIGKLPVTGPFWIDVTSLKSPPTPGPAQGPSMSYLSGSIEGIMVYDQSVSLPETSPHLPDWFSTPLDGSIDGKMNLFVVEQGVGGGIRFDSTIQAGGGYELEFEDAAAPLQASAGEFQRTPEMPLIPHVRLTKCKLSVPAWLNDLGFPATLPFDAQGTEWGGEDGDDQNLRLERILSRSDQGQIDLKFDGGGGTPVEVALDGEAEVSFHMHSGIVASGENRQSSNSGLLTTPVMQLNGRPYHIVVHSPEIGFGNSTARIEELRFSNQVSGSAPFSTHWVLPETSAYRIGLEGIQVDFRAGKDIETSVSSTEPGGSLVKFPDAEVTDLGLFPLARSTTTVLGQTITYSPSGTSGHTIRIPGIADHWDTDRNEFEDFTMRLNTDYAFDTQFDSTSVRITTGDGLILDFSDQESHVEDASGGSAKRGFVLPKGTIQGSGFFGGSRIDIVDFYLTQGGFGGTVEKQNIELNPIPGLTIKADSIGVGFSNGGYAKSNVKGGKVSFHPPITAPGEKKEVSLNSATYKTGQNGGMAFYAEGSFSSGELSLPGKFTLADLGNFLLDFSATSPDPPPNWAGNASLTSWKGVYFESGTFRIPLKHQGGDRLDIGWEGLKVDAQGASGTFSPDNTVNVQQPFGIPGLELEIEDSSSLTMKNFALTKGDLDGSVTYSFGGNNGDRRTIAAKNFSMDVRNQQVGFLCEQFQLPNNFSSVTFGKWDLSVDKIGIDISSFSNVSNMPGNGYGDDYRGLLLSGGLDWEKKVNVGPNRNKKKTFTFQADDLTIPFSNGKLSGSFSFQDQAERLKFDLPWGENGYVWFRSGGLEIEENQFKKATLDGELRVPENLKKTQPPSQQGGGQLDGLLNNNIDSVINRAGIEKQVQRQRQYYQIQNPSGGSGGNN